MVRKTISKVGQFLLYTQKKILIIMTQFKALYVFILIYLSFKIEKSIIKCCFRSLFSIFFLSRSLCKQNDFRVPLTAFQLLFLPVFFFRSQICKKKMSPKL